jgi:hypothetical protein
MLVAVPASRRHPRPWSACGTGEAAKPPAIEVAICISVARKKMAKNPGPPGFVGPRPMQLYAAIGNASSALLGPVSRVLTVTLPDPQLFPVETKSAPSDASVRIDTNPFASRHTRRIWWSRAESNRRPKNLCVASTSNGGNYTTRVRPCQRLSLGRRWHRSLSPEPGVPCSAWTAAFRTLGDPAPLSGSWGHRSRWER